MRALLSGWFSFEGMGATAGDLLAARVAERWLVDAGHQVEVACAPPFEATVTWELADPRAFDAVVFVCGPFGNGPPLTRFLERFQGCRLVGLDLTMLEPLETWNPFDVLIERDSTRRTNPDLAVAGQCELAPVIGLVLIHEQPEYGVRDVHALANAKLEALVEQPGFVRLPIDTRLDLVGSRLRTSAEVTSLIARTDVVLTSRLHGLVLAIRSGVPVVAVDPVDGRAKVSRQAAALEWPWCFGADVTLEELEHAFAECLSPAGRSLAMLARERAMARIEQLRGELLEGVAALDPGAVDSGKAATWRE